MISFLNHYYYHFQRTHTHSHGKQLKKIIPPRYICCMCSLRKISRWALYCVPPTAKKVCNYYGYLSCALLQFAVELLLYLLYQIMTQHHSPSSCSLLSFACCEIIWATKSQRKKTRHPFFALLVPHHNIKNTRTNQQDGGIALARSISGVKTEPFSSMKRLAITKRKVLA